MSRSFTFCAPSEYKQKWVSLTSGSLILANTAKAHDAGNFLHFNLQYFPIELRSFRFFHRFLAKIIEKLAWHVFITKLI